ncbi:MAG TPA: hypothetical protein VMP01_17380 [Pirellulaceae bacterium]|nr:hypothetical protein [Pirellulaceae bacterium]
MNALGWIMMITSVGTVLALITFCLSRVMSLPPAEVDDLTSPLEIDTRDTKDAD